LVETKIHLMKVFIKCVLFVIQNIYRHCVTLLLNFVDDVKKYYGVEVLNVAQFVSTGRN